MSEATVLRFPTCSCSEHLGNTVERVLMLLMTACGTLPLTGYFVFTHSVN